MKLCCRSTVLTASLALLTTLCLSPTASAQALDQKTAERVHRHAERHELEAARLMIAAAILRDAAPDMVGIPQEVRDAYDSWRTAFVSPVVALGVSRMSRSLSTHLDSEKLVYLRNAWRNIKDGDKLVRGWIYDRMGSSQSLVDGPRALSAMISKWFKTPIGFGVGLLAIGLSAYSWSDSLSSGAQGALNDAWYSGLAKDYLGYDRSVGLRVGFHIHNLSDLYELDTREIGRLKEWLRDTLENQAAEQNYAPDAIYNVDLVGFILQENMGKMADPDIGPRIRKAVEEYRELAALANEVDREADLNAKAQIDPLLQFEKKREECLALAAIVEGINTTVKLDPAFQRYADSAIMRVKRRIHAADEFLSMVRGR